MKDVSDVSRLRRFVFWKVILLPTYVLVACLAGLAAIRDTWLPVARAVASGAHNSPAFLEAAARGPTTTAFNHRMRDRALAAQLVGSVERRVPAVLGEPDYVRQFWEVIGANGFPSPGSESVTTYEYYVPKRPSL